MNKQSGFYKNGKSHAEGGIPVLVDGSNPIEVEKFEYFLCNNAINSTKIFEFKDKTNKEILDEIFRYSDCEFEQNKANSGDFIICKLAVMDKKKRNITGTAKEIINVMQSEKSCNVTNDSKEFKDGGSVNNTNLLAPNGKHSNLDEIYYIPTDKSKEIITDFTHYKSGENYYPITQWANWFISQDRKSKEYIANFIRNNNKLRNAFISNWYDDYKTKNNNITFEEFLNKDIEVYRGQTSRDLKYGQSFGFDSYTTDKSLAEHFARDGNGFVIKKIVKPKETYGMIQSIGNEKEVMIPTKFSNEFLQKEWYDLSNKNIKIFDNLSDKDMNEFEELENSKNYQGLIDKLNDMLNIKSDNNFEKGGEINDETYTKWKNLVNMSKSELENFYESKEGKEAGLSSSEAKEQGISSGRESARWIMKMKDTPKNEWTPTMWKWANKQISFISRMSGMKGDLYDDKGNKTRKHTSLLIWGHNPKKYNNGGELNTNEMENKENKNIENLISIMNSKVKNQGYSLKELYDEVVKFQGSKDGALIFSEFIKRKKDEGDTKIMDEFNKTSFVENANPVNKTETLQGGKADKLTIEDIAKKHNVSLEYAKEQLNKGMKIESEHTKDTEKQKEIALDHLSEFIEYYKELDKMEEKLKEEENINLDEEYSILNIELEESLKTGNKYKIEASLNKLLELINENPYLYPLYVKNSKDLPKKFIKGTNPYLKNNTEPKVIEWLDENNLSLFDLYEIKKYELPKYKPFNTNSDDKIFMSIHGDFVSNDDLRPNLLGINFNEKGVVSTDAHKLLFTEYNGVKDEKYGNYCYTKKCFDSLKTVEEAKYPNWTVIIPRDSPNKVVLNTKYLYTFLKNVLKYSLSTNEDNNIIAFELENENNNIAFNAELLLDVVEAMAKLGHKELEMSFSQPNRGALIYPIGKSNKVDSYQTDFCLLMPLRILDYKEYTLYYNLENNCAKYIQENYSSKSYCFDEEINRNNEIEKLKNKISEIEQKSKKEVEKLVEPIEIIEPKTEIKEQSNEQKELKEAINTFEELIKLGGTDAEMKEWQEAIDTFKMLLDDEPTKYAKGGNVEKQHSDLEKEIMESQFGNLD